MRGNAQLVPAVRGECVREIASRYLGDDAGSNYAEGAGDDMLIQLKPGSFRAWDFSDVYH